MENFNIKISKLSRLELCNRFLLIHHYVPNRAVPLCRLCRHLPFTEGESTPSLLGKADGYRYLTVGLTRFCFY